jgi:Fe-S cluster biogenesis protein NfuA
MPASAQTDVQADVQPEVGGTIAPPQRSPFRLQTERVEKLAARLESAGDPEVRATALDLVQTVVELHGAALRCLIDSLTQTPAGQQALSDALENDLVSSMLLLHNLHPDGLETRVLRGIEKARPYLKSHGGDVELTAVRDGIVHLRLHGTCGSCPSSSITLKNAVEDALFEVAPDIVEIISENAVAAHAGPQLVTLS